MKFLGFAVLFLAAVAYAAEEGEKKVEKRGIIGGYGLGYGGYGLGYGGFGGYGLGYGVAAPVAVARVAPVAYTAPVVTKVAAPVAVAAAPVAYTAPVAVAAAPVAYGGHFGYGGFGGFGGYGYGYGLGGYKKFW